MWTYGRAGFLSSGRGRSTTVFCWPSSTPNRTGGRSGTSSAPSPSRDPVPTTRQQAEAEIKALAGARPGEWVTWKVYDRSRRQLASVVARDLRTGRIAAVRRSRLHIDSLVTPTADGRFVVEIARTAENAS